MFILFSSFSTIFFFGFWNTFLNLHFFVYMLNLCNVFPTSKGYSTWATCFLTSLFLLSFWFSRHYVISCHWYHLCNMWENTFLLCLCQNLCLCNYHSWFLVFTTIVCFIFFFYHLFNFFQIFLYLWPPLPLTFCCLLLNFSSILWYAWSIIRN